MGEVAQDALKKWQLGQKLDDALPGSTKFRSSDLVNAVALTTTTMMLLIIHDLVFLWRQDVCVTFPPDVYAGLLYVASALGFACVIDRDALLHMFFSSPTTSLNWIAAVGLICSALKLTIVNKIANYEQV